MKIKQDKTFYISRAKRDIRDLFIYFNITRPQHEKEYFKDGKFSLKEMVRQMEFLDGWSKRSSAEKKYLANQYARCSRTFNYVFGIPKDLIGKVAGVYYDENNKQHCVSVEQIVQELVNEGFIKVVNAGRKFNKNEDGSYEVKCYWCKKYIMANRKQWFKLMTDEHYDNINKYGSKRLRKIVFKWIESFKEKRIEDKQEQHVEVQQKQTSNTTVKEVKEVMNDSKKKEVIKKVIVGCLERGIINPETSVQWMGDLVYWRKQNPFTIDEAKMLYNTNPVEDKLKVKNAVLKCLTSFGVSQHEAIYILIDGVSNLAA